MVVVENCDWRLHMEKSSWDKIISTFWNDDAYQSTVDYTNETMVSKFGEDYDSRAWKSRDLVDLARYLFQTWRAMGLHVRGLADYVIKLEDRIAILEEKLDAIQKDN